MEPDEIEAMIHLTGCIDSVLNTLLTTKQRDRLSARNLSLERVVYLFSATVEDRRGYIRTIAQQVGEIMKERTS